MEKPLRSIEECMSSLERHIKEKNQREREAEAAMSKHDRQAIQQAKKTLLVPDVSSNVVRLPLWADEVRAIPNGILRSALFGAIRKGRRPILDDKIIASVEGVEIRYKGDRLDQADLTVWETILHSFKDQNLGEERKISSYALLKIMGKTISGKSRSVLYSNILRLKANAISVKQGKHTYIGSLIDEAYKDDETDEWVFVLNKKLKNLFMRDSFTQIDWKVRQTLEGQQLAQWLHGFYSTHAEPYPIKIETLRELSGSEAGELWKFKQSLQKALKALKEACQAQGQCFSYEIRGDKVLVDRIGTAAQQKHLARKANKKKPKGSR